MKTFRKLLKVMAWSGIIVVFVLMMGMCRLAVVNAHENKILDCEQNISVKEATLLKADLANVEALGLGRQLMWGEMYQVIQTDGKRIKIVALSEVTGIALDENNKPVYLHQNLPLYYVVDTDNDGKPDAVYVDKFGKPKDCEGVVLYKDLTDPSQAWPDVDGAPRANDVGDLLHRSEWELSPEANPMAVLPYTLTVHAKTEPGVLQHMIVFGPFDSLKECQDAREQIMQSELTKEAGLCEPYNAEDWK